MPLFEVVILEKPTKKEAEEGIAEKLILGPKAVIAKDAQGALLAVMMNGDRPAAVDISRVEVLIRPFA